MIDEQPRCGNPACGLPIVLLPATGGEGPTQGSLFGP